MGKQKYTLGLPYDLCKLVDDAKSDVFPRAKRHGSAFEFWEPPERVTLGQQINKGSTGRIFHGTFGTRAVAIKVNNPYKVSLKTDENEVRMQTRLYCHMLEKKGLGPTARIPTTYFAATIPTLGRALGMERMDRSLMAHLTKKTTGDLAQISFLKNAMDKVASLLAVLQRDLKFMHGDLHGENVMVGDSPLTIYLIDFGMSSIATGRWGGKRMVTDDRYLGAPFNSHLDLLTLLTSLREDLALAKHKKAAQWCNRFVEPFWSTVRNGLFSGMVRGKLRYSAQETVRVARDEIKDNGEIYYAHHLLYEDIGKVSFPPCAPKAFLKALASQKGTVTARELQVRIFSDI